MLKAERSVAHPAADSAEDDIEQSDEADESEQHRANVEGEFQAGGGADGGGIEDVRGIFIAFGKSEFALLRHADLWFHQFCVKEPPGSCHEGGSQQVFHLHTHRGVTRENGAGNAGEASHHDRE